MNIITVKKQFPVKNLKIKNDEIVFILYLYLN